jgi:hypothetical protein
LINQRGKGEGGYIRARIHIGADQVFNRLLEGGRGGVQAVMGHLPLRRGYADRGSGGDDADRAFTGPLVTSDDEDAMTPTDEATFIALGQRLRVSVLFSNVTSPTAMPRLECCARGGGRWLSTIKGGLQAVDHASGFGEADKPYHHVQGWEISPRSRSKACRSASSLARPPSSMIAARSAQSSRHS